MSDGRVKNRAPAPVQVTAEQLLSEAAEYQHATAKRPRADPLPIDREEVQEYRAHKRREFEQAVQRGRTNFTAWAKYANWEAADGGGYARARSVFERALDVDPASMKLWSSYTEMELRGGHVNHARNLYERVTAILPRVDHMWYKYVHLEETLGNVPGARRVFENWMQWGPDEKAWLAYIKMECRYKEFARASLLYERMVNAHPEPRNFIAWAKFEEDERSNLPRAREVFSMAFEFFGQNSADEIMSCQSAYTAFARMEARHKHFDRARAIYKFVIDRVPRSRSSQVLAAYAQFEKQFGSQDGIDFWVLEKRRIHYDAELKKDPANYDSWVDLIRLEQQALRDHAPGASVDRVRTLYSDATRNVPVSRLKYHWRRYIYLWLFWALFEEAQASPDPSTADAEGSATANAATGDSAQSRVAAALTAARNVYKQCIDTVPNAQFSFAKMWTQFALFELRHTGVPAARKVFGAAIGIAPKPKLFKNYIEFELRTRDFDRCRIIYQRWLQYDPTSSAVWIKFAELESALLNPERARAIFELGLQQPAVDVRDLLWKSYIDFEAEEEQYDTARSLYRRLLDSSAQSIEVWLSYASFEAVVAEDVDRARAVYREASEYFKTHKLARNRHVILEAWAKLEDEHDPHAAQEVRDLFPEYVKRADSDEYDLVFKDEQKPVNKLLDMAHKWKMENK